MQDVGVSEHGSVPGHQPGINKRHVAQVTGVHKDHATAGDGGWRGILQVTHLQFGMCDIKLPNYASTVLLTSQLSTQHSQLAAHFNVQEKSSHGA